jgi:hypothetical protein
MKTLSVLISLLLLLASPVLAQSSLYRWIDTEGNINYSDTIPPESVSQGGVQLNRQGVPVRNLERVLSPEERQIEMEKQRVQAAREKMQRQQASIEWALVGAYRNENDILLAKQEKLDAIEASERVVQGNILRSKQQLTDDPNLSAAQIAEIEKRIGENYETLFRFAAEKEEIHITFDLTLERFRLIKARGLEEDGAESSALILTGRSSTHLRCPDPASCQDWWRNARRYVLKHSDTELLSETDSMLISRIPELPQQIGLNAIMSRGVAAQLEIMLDLECAPTAAGNETCRSERAQLLRANFRGAIISLDETTP